jgi:hypothetical protein
LNKTRDRVRKGEQDYEVHRDWTKRGPENGIEIDAEGQMGWNQTR